MKTAESAIKELISRIENAKVESRNPNNRTKRTGEYRIGLSQAINLAHDVIAELAEELASHPCPVEYPEAIIANFQPTYPMSAEQVEELGYYYPLFKFFSDEHGLSLLDSQLQDVIHECKKFIEPASPSVKADGWVNVKEKQRLEQIIELKEKERQEWANLCIKKEKILEGLIAGYCTVNEYMYNEYGKLILKEISETFLKNATNADKLSDTEVFQALGETILNFPLPAPPKQQL